jgi:8-oxo-dGTP pyrophosphatase MutT (NUDIX family)
MQLLEGNMRQAVRAIVVNGSNMLVMKRNKFGKVYYTLVGGGIDMGESPETAIRRELMEECGMSVGPIRPVYVEDAGEPYGTQYVYLCEYISGEPRLSPDSPEAKVAALGQNIYEPMWLPIAELDTIPFLSGSQKDALMHAFKHGFPPVPQLLEWHN